jgi:hypothetical protein
MLCRLDETVEKRGASAAQLSSLPTQTAPAGGLQGEGGERLACSVCLEVRGRRALCCAARAPAARGAPALPPRVCLAAAAGRTRARHPLRRSRAPPRRPAPPQEFDEGQQLCTLPCVHKFHTGCITSWLKQKATCPVCQRKL